MFSDMYQEQFADLDNKPYHLFFSARLVDVPLLTDIVGVVPEARQRLELVECKVLQSEVHVPIGFVNRATPTILPYTFAPGPKAGYYMMKMSGEARFVPQRREEEMPMPEQEVDFGPDDFQEATEPALSTFDVDVGRAQPARTATMFGALERLQKMRKATASASEMSAKRKGKQLAVARPTEPQPSMSTGTETTTSGSTEPDYLGLLEGEEFAAAVSPTFSSRLVQMAGSTSAVVNVAATGEMEDEEQLGEEETEVEESSELKRRRTRDTQSTGVSMQDVKRSKTISFLRDLQKKAKKK
ncbi:unnamed protein product [Mucor fragilis]